MASFNNGSHTGASSSFDNLLIQNLMGRLHLRPPYVDTNSFLSHTLDDFLFEDEDEPLLLGRDSDESPLGGGGGGQGRTLLAREETLLAREEAKLEKEIVRIIRSGAASEALKPNSGQSVAIGDHNICVGYHEEPGSEYRVWEWHGHIMLFDDEDGFSPEYVYGNYFERVPVSAGSKEGGGGGEEDEKGRKEKKVTQSGLRDLIGDERSSGGSEGRRVLHRNSLNSGLRK